MAVAVAMCRGVQSVAVESLVVAGEGMCDRLSLISRRHVSQSLINSQHVLQSLISSRHVS